MVRARYEMPGALRPASLSDRRAFYARGMDYHSAARWFAGHPGERMYAVIVGRHTGVYPKRFRHLKNIVLRVESARRPEDLRPFLLKYLPEGVYYDRNEYASLDEALGSGLDFARPWRRRPFLGQELAFDLDPENLDCPVHGDVAAKMERRQGLSFCDWEYEEVRSQAAALHDELRRTWTRVRAVFSGRGFHLHVLDRDAFRLGKGERVRIARSFGARYAIDEWVTSGDMRLIRLPHSLHGMTSRVVVPVPRGRLERFRYDDPRAGPPRLR